MGERALSIARPDYSDRRNVYFFVAKWICLISHRVLVRPHIEMHEDVLSLKRCGGAVFLYCGLHKSLWETSGVLPPLHLARLPLPYVGMGDNLVKGKIFQAISKKVGTFLVRRPGSRREMLSSARRLRDDVLSFIAHGLDVLLFPEGTRKNIPSLGHYGDFFPAAFDALLEYERNRDLIRANSTGAAAYETYAVPFNVDYSRVREAREMAGKAGSKPLTLHVFDAFSMIRGIGDTYISFGKPIRVADHVDLDRKGLAALCRRSCLDLVKILPVNVASHALLQLPAGSKLTPDTLGPAIRSTIESLRPFAKRFRGFSTADDWSDVIRRATAVPLRLERVPEDVALYRLYAAYIRHYLDPAPTP